MKKTKWIRMLLIIPVLICILVYDANALYLRGETTRVDMPSRETDGRRLGTRGDSSDWRRGLGPQVRPGYDDYYYSGSTWRRGPGPQIRPGTTPFYFPGANPDIYPHPNPPYPDYNSNDYYYNNPYNNPNYGNYNNGTYQNPNSGKCYFLNCDGYDTSNGPGYQGSFNDGNDGGYYNGSYYNGTYYDQPYYNQGTYDPYYGGNGYGTSQFYKTVSNISNGAIITLTTDNQQIVQNMHDTAYETLKGIFRNYDIGIATNDLNNGVKIILTSYDTQSVYYIQNFASVSMPEINIDGRIIDWQGT